MDLKITSFTIRDALNVENINELSDEKINKINNLILCVDKESFDEIDKIDDRNFEQEISEVLQYLPKLKELSLWNIVKDRETRINISLSGLSEEVEKLLLEGVDLSEKNLKEFFKKHKNISSIDLNNCNISDLTFLEFLPENIQKISLCCNPILAKYADDVLRYIGKIPEFDISYCDEIMKEFEARGYEFSPFLTENRGKLNGEQFYETFKNALYAREFTVNDMSQLSQYIDFFSDKREKEERKIFLDDIENLSEEYIKNINLFAKGENTILVLTAEKAQMLKGMIDKDIKVQLLIKNASELSVEQLDELEKKFSLINIKIDDPEQSLDEEQKVPYDIDTYRRCRSKIDELLQDIDLNFEDQNRDKKIFGKVLKRLAEHMSYDFVELKKEEKESEQIFEEIEKKLEKEGKNNFLKNYYVYQELLNDGNEMDKSAIVCRNMEGGLINNTCVCAGYAEIVRNVFACCGIESKYISGSNVSEIEDVKTWEQVYGHAWNQIKLDGKWYNLDLTWDRDSIVEGKKTEFTLKSDEDFEHGEFDISKEIKHKCEISLEVEEVESYIYGENYTKKVEDKKTSEVNLSEDSIQTKYYSPNNINGKVPMVNLSKKQLSKDRFLKVLESDLNESDIRKSQVLLAKTKEKREQTSEIVEMEDNYDNR